MCIGSCPAFPSDAAAAAPPPASQQSAKTARQIDDEIRKLQRGPGLKPVSDAYEEMNQLDQQAEERRSAIQERVDKLMQTPEYQRAATKLRELESQRDIQWEAERKALADAARELYG